MKSQIALLRGINVGGKNVLPMAELIEIFHSMECNNVRTYIQSGNVVFDSSKNYGEKEATLISMAIAEVKGFTPHVLILTKRELCQAIENNPFPSAEGKTLHFFFLDKEPKHPNIDRLTKAKVEPEAFMLAGKVFYLLSPNGIGRSKLAAAVEPALGVQATARNLNTILKLASMTKEEES